mmetsp:Transcript_11863/g.15092  ORF Transcript_11863/g.15092 Transcript_11863/m.15092 type:complete len:125 (+) Transcript_11863:327-701(+)
MYRATPKAFATNPIAAKLSYKLYHNKEQWAEYKTLERHFLLLPMMHAEEKTYGQTMVDAYIKMDRELAESDPTRYNETGLGKFVQSLLMHSQNHFAPVQRFGRYPHRNKHLGRESTPEEFEYLH